MLTPVEYKFLEKLTPAQLHLCGFMYENHTKIGTTDIDTGNAHIVKLANGEADCWNILVSDKESLLKKYVVITDWSMFNEEMHQDIDTWISSLLAENFKLYIWTGSLIRIRSVLELSLYSGQIEPVSAETIVQLFEAKNKRKDTLKIVDCFEKQRIRALLKPALFTEAVLNFKLFDDNNTIGSRKAILESLPPESSIHLEIDSHDIHRNIAQTLLKLPQINGLTLSIKQTFDPAEFESAHKIKHLRCTGGEIAWDTFFFNLLPNMHTLTLEGLEQVQATHIPQLKKLYVSDCSRKFLLNLLAQNHQVELLDVKHIKSFPGKNKQKTTISLKQVHTLSLCNISTNLCKKILNATPEIEHLTIKNVVVDTNTYAQPFHKLKHVSFIDSSITPISNPVLFTHKIESLHIENQSFPLSSLRFMPKLKKLSIKMPEIYDKLASIIQIILLNAEFECFDYITTQSTGTTYIHYVRNKTLIIQMDIDDPECNILNLFLKHTEKLESLIFKTSKKITFPDDIFTPYKTKLDSIKFLELPASLSLRLYPPLVEADIHFCSLKNTVEITGKRNFQSVKNVLLHPDLQVNRLIIKANGTLNGEIDSPQPFLNIEYLEIASAHIRQKEINALLKLIPNVKKLSLPSLDKHTDFCNFHHLTYLHLHRANITHDFALTGAQLRNHAPNLQSFSLSYCPDEAHNWFLLYFIQFSWYKSIKNCALPLFTYVKNKKCILNHTVKERYIFTLLQYMEYGESLRIKQVINYERIEPLLTKFNLHKLDLTLNVSDKHTSLASLAMNILKNHPNLEHIFLRLYRNETWFILRSTPDKADEKNVLKTNESLSTEQLLYFWGRLRALNHMKLNKLHRSDRKGPPIQYTFLTMYIAHHQSFKEYFAWLFEYKNTAQSWLMHSPYASMTCDCLSLHVREISEDRLIEFFGFFNNVKKNNQKLILHKPSMKHIKMNVLNTYVQNHIEILELVLDNINIPLIRLCIQFLHQGRFLNTLLIKNADQQVLLSIKLSKMQYSTLELSGPAFSQKLIAELKNFRCATLYFKNFHCPEQFQLPAYTYNHLFFSHTDVTLDFFKNLPKSFIKKNLAAIYMSDCPFIDMEKLSSILGNTVEISTSKQGTFQETFETESYSSIDYNTGEQLPENAFLKDQTPWFESGTGKTSIENYLRLFVDIHVPSNPVPIEVPVVNDPEEIQKQFRLHDHNPEIFISQYLSMKLQARVMHRLPSLSPQDEILCFYASEPVSFYYDSATNLYSIVSQKSVELDFCILLQAKIQVTVLTKNFWKQYKHWFPCLQALKLHKNQIKPFYEQQFEALKKLPNDLKRDIALAFCASFETLDLSKNVQNDKILTQIFKERRGVCRHKIEALKVLVRLLEITGIREVGNNVHELAEIFVDGSWKMICVGGAEMPSVIANSEMHKDAINPFQKIPLEYSPPPEASKTALIKASSTCSSSKKHKVTMHSVSALAPNLERISPEKNFPNPFNHPKNPILLPVHDFKQLCDAVLTKGFALPAGQKNLLIQFQNASQIEQFHAALAARTHHPHRYICMQSLNELRPDEIKIDASEFTRPVFHIITEITTASAGDLFMVDISDYQRSIVNTLNALVDTTGRKITGLPVSRDLLIIVVKRKTTALENDALSRFKDEFYEAPLLSEQDLLAPFCVQSKTIPENALDFSMDDSWQKYLPGTFRLLKNQLVFEQGILLNPEKKALYCYNLPLHLPDVRFFLLTLFYGKTFYANGQYHPVSPDFRIYHAVKSHDSGCSHLPYSIEAFAQNTVQDFVLNRMTFFQFFNNYFCHHEQLIHQSGWLDTPNKTQIRILVTETLDNILFAQLLHQANLLKKHCIFSFAPSVSIPTVMHKKMQLPASGITGSCHNLYILSSDADFSEKEFVQKALSKIRVITISKQTRFSELFEGLEIIRKEHCKSATLPVSWKPGIVHTLLSQTDPQNVILKGTPNLEVMQKLQTLFQPQPHLFINNKKTFYTGKLMLLTEEKLPWRIPCHKIEYTLDDYQTLLCTQYDTSTLDSWKKLYTLFITNAKEAAISLPWGFSQYEKMLRIYAQYPDHNPFLPFTRIHPQAARLAEIAHKLCPDMHKNPDKETALLSQRTTELKWMSGLFHCVLINGISGTGKSTFMHHYLKSKPGYTGFDNFDIWLKKGGIFFLDNIQRYPKGSLDRLQCILQSQKQDVLDNNIDGHTLILAGNFDKQEMPNRHTFLDKLPVITFSPFPDAYLKQDLVIPALKNMPEKLHRESVCKIADLVMEIFCQIRTQLPNTPWTPRNLESILVRFALYREKNPSLSPENSAALSILDEMEHDMDIAVKTRLQMTLKERFPQAKQYALQLNSLFHIHNSGFTLTGCRKNMYRIILDHIAQERLKIKYPILNTLPAFLALLLQGSSGTGKSHTIIHALEASGFHNGAIPEKSRKKGARYYHFVTAEHYRDLHQEDKMSTFEIHLTKIFHQGDWLVIDELNTLPHLNKILLAFLSGVDLAGKPATNPGFRLLATQNPVSYTGRDNIYSMKNLFFFMKTPEYSEQGLKEIAVDKKLNPVFAHTVSSFFTQKQKIHYSLREVNTRDFLEKIHELKMGFFATMPEKAMNHCVKHMQERDRKALQCTSTVYNRVMHTLT